MFDRSQLTRLITLALASCAVTWAFAAGAFARPDVATNTGAANTAPAYQPQIGDALKTPNPVQVQHVLNGIGNKGALPHSAANSSHDVDPLVIVLSIVAVMVALGAMTLIVTHRQHRPVLRA